MEKNFDDGRKMIIQCVELLKNKNADFQKKSLVFQKKVLPLPDGNSWKNTFSANAAGFSVIRLDVAAAWALPK